MCIRDRDNHSCSSRNVLRGLHYQVKQPQGKLVRVVEGEILDAAVDVRRSSPSFGHWEAVRLSGDNKRMLWIPLGFAHGFRVLSEKAHVLYKATDFYAPEHERTIVWNDPHLKINWELDGEPMVSPLSLIHIYLQQRHGVPEDLIKNIAVAGALVAKAVE